MGASILRHLNDNTILGIFGGIFFSTGKETEVSQDTSDSWSERDVDTTYFSLYESTLNSHVSYQGTGTRPYLTLTFEKKIKKNLVLRSFFYYTQAEQDIKARYSSDDTTFSDRTYDYWIASDTYVFRRFTSSGVREFILSGSGKENVREWKFLTSLIYTLDNDWLIFGGAQISQVKNESEGDENSSFYSNDSTQYLYYVPETERQLRTNTKIYSYEAQSENWNVVFPIGIKAKLARGFYALLGTEVKLSLTSEKSSCDQLYPVIIACRWLNGSVIADDPEINRYEKYQTKPPKTFTRTTTVRFGMVYEHPSGAKLFIRSNGDIMNANGWTLGFEMNW